MDKLKELRDKLAEEYAFNLYDVCPADIAFSDGWDACESSRLDYFSRMQKLQAEITEHSVTRKELERQIEVWKMNFESMSKSQYNARCNLAELESENAALKLKLAKYERERGES